MGLTSIQNNLWGVQHTGGKGGRFPFAWMSGRIVLFGTSQLSEDAVAPARRGFQPEGSHHAAEAVNHGLPAQNSADSLGLRTWGFGKFARLSSQGASLVETVFWSRV